MRNPNLQDPSKYVSITMEFRCNLKCVHCMIEGTMDWLQPAGETQFQSVLDEQRNTKRWDGLILTGSEITLNRNLPDMASQARLHGFDYVRIQTHGMHLGKKDYLTKVLDSGVNEFFISVAGANEKSHDLITKVNGSFRKMLQGIEMIEEIGEAIVLTNTVVTQKSYKELDGIVNLLADYKKVVQHEFWNYFPMAEEDVKNLIVDYKELMPYVHKAILACHTYNKSIELKNIPECLLGNHRETLVNEQPSLFIDPAFWMEFDKNQFHQCVYRDQCRSQTCLGLTEAYIRKYGHEENSLYPI
jgi:MoaA/NifB/PqqE/SkfB family radical SAM enzyme